MLDLTAPLDRAALEAAVADLLADHPLLATTLARRPWGFARRPRAVEVSRVLACHPDHTPDREAAFMAAPWDLAGPPLRLLVQHHEGRARLVAAVLHAAADALGSFLLLDRLALRYAERLAGAPPAPPRAEVAHRSLAGLLAPLPWGRRLAVLTRGARHPRETLATLRGEPWATFMDHPLPAPLGSFHWVVHSWSPDEVMRLRAAARAREATLNDLLVAAMLVRGAALWPQPVPRPALVRLPVNLRERPEGVANVVSEVLLRVPAAALASFDAALAAVRAARPPEGMRERGLANLYANLPFSYMPPVAFRLGFAGLRAARDNRLMTFGFSNAGDLGDLPRAFGPADVASAAFVGQVSAPPGLFAWVTTARGRLTLVLGYRHPAVDHAKAGALLAGVAETLAPLATPGLVEERA